MADESVFSDVLQQFSERFAESENFAEIRSREIAAGTRGVGTLAADLNHSDHLVARKNRRADDFLNRFTRVDAARLHALKNSRVTRRRKTVVDLGPTFANSARGQSGVTGQRNEANVAQSFWKKKIKMTPLHRQSQNADFFGLHVEIAGDAFGDGSPRDGWRFGADVAKRN